MGQVRSAGRGSKKKLWEHRQALAAKDDCEIDLSHGPSCGPVIGSEPIARREERATRTRRSKRKTASASKERNPNRPFLRMSSKTLLEVQFPIGPLSLESYKERDAKSAKVLASLGKWWGAKPLVLVRAIVIAAVFPASDDPECWPEDLAMFMKVMCMDNAGMWKRKTAPLPAELCYEHADDVERECVVRGGRETLETTCFSRCPTRS